VRWLWGDKFWTAGKFYRSVGAVSAERCMGYIKTAEARHFAPMPLDKWVGEKQAKLEQFFGAHFSAPSNSPGFSPGCQRF
jgi:hypothetical protein